MSKLFKDLTNQKIGGLTVQSRAANTKDGTAQWNCVCDCGNTKIIKGSSLRKENPTKSCGCRLVNKCPIKDREKYLEYHKTYREKNKIDRAKTVANWQKANQEYIKNYRVEYSRKNKVALNEKARNNYYLNNRAKLIEFRKLNPKPRKPKGPKKSRAEYMRIRRKNDIEFKLSCNLRRRVNKFIKRNKKQGSAIKDLGCTLGELKSRLESLFQPGMTWENYGSNGWHVDHIKPLSKFNLTDPEQFRNASHYTNLQPLWALDNIKKGNK